MGMVYGTSTTHSDLADRLQTCATTVGSRRALAEASQTSESQLFRYLKGQIEPPASKVTAIANAAGLDPGWVLTGAGQATPIDPRQHSQLLEDVVRLFEETLIEYEHPITPQRKSKLIPLLLTIYQAERRHQAGLPSVLKSDMAWALDYLSYFKTNEQLTELHQAIHLISSPKEPHFDDSYASIINHLCLAKIHYYNSRSGYHYFNRIGSTLNNQWAMQFGAIIHHIQQQLSTLSTDLKWLDLGCGNGRHLRYLKENHPEFQLAGIEPSALAFSHLTKLEQSGKLAPDTIKQADVRHLPYPDKSFDVIFCYYTMPSLPYLPGSGHGVEEMMREVARVLKPGGCFFSRTYAGDQRRFLPFWQPYTKNNIEDLATKTNLELPWYQESSFNDVSALSNPGNKSPYEDARVLDFIYKKSS